MARSSSDAASSIPHASGSVKLSSNFFGNDSDLSSLPLANPNLSNSRDSGNAQSSLNLTSNSTLSLSQNGPPSQRPAPDPVSARTRHSPMSPLHHNKQKLIDADPNHGKNDAPRKADLMRFNRIGLLASRELARLDRYHHRKTHTKKKRFTPDELQDINSQAEDAVKSVQSLEGPKRLRTGLLGTLDLLEIKDEPELLMHNHPNSKVNFALLRQRISTDHYTTIDMFKVEFRNMCHETMRANPPHTLLHRKTVAFLAAGLDIIVGRLEYDYKEDARPCRVCGSVSRPEETLLCDCCNDPYHMSCLPTPMVDVPRGDWYCESCQIINQNVDRLDYVKRKKRKLAKMKYYEDLSDSEEVSLVLEPESTSSDDDERMERLRRKRRRLNESHHATIVHEAPGEEAVRAHSAQNDGTATPATVHAAPPAKEQKPPPSTSHVDPSFNLQAALDSAQANPASAKERPRSIVEETLMPNASCHFELVKSIVGRRLRGGELQYKVKWTVASREPSWVYAATMRDCEALLTGFESKYADLIKKKTEEEAKK